MSQPFKGRAGIKGPISFIPALLISAALHGGLVGLWLYGGRLLPAGPPPDEVLTLELFGMITDRQLEERQAGAEPEPEQPPPPPEPEPEPEQAPPPPPPPEPEPESVPPPKKEQPAPRPKPKAKPKPARPAPRPRGEAQEAQAQQTISQKQMDQLVMKQYVAQMSKQLQGRLRYPAEAKAKSQTGNVTISFRVLESGAIQSGSARVSKSSGYSMLDQAALQTVQGSRLPKPPKAINVSVSFNFRAGK